MAHNEDRNIHKHLDEHLYCVYYEDVILARVISTGLRLTKA